MNLDGMTRHDDDNDDGADLRNGDADSRSGKGGGGGSKWDPSREIAAGSVSANAARLFGAGGLLKGGGNGDDDGGGSGGGISSPPAYARRSVSRIQPPTFIAGGSDSGATREGGGGGGGMGGDAGASKSQQQHHHHPTGERWDPSSEIKKGSVMANAAMLWGDKGAFGGAAKKRTPPPPTRPRPRPTHATPKDAVEVTGTSAVEVPPQPKPTPISTPVPVDKEAEDEAEAVAAAEAEATAEENDVVLLLEETGTDDVAEAEAEMAMALATEMANNSTLGADDARRKEVEEELSRGLEAAAAVAEREELEMSAEAEEGVVVVVEADPEAEAAVAEEAIRETAEEEEEEEGEEMKALREAEVAAAEEARRREEEEEHARVMAEAEARAKAEEEAASAAAAEARAMEEERRKEEEEEERARAEAEAQAKAKEEAAAAAAEADARAMEEARRKEEERASAEAEAEAEAKAKAEEEERARAEAKAKAKEEERTRAEAKAKAKAKEEKRARAEAKAKAEEEAAAAAAEAAAAAARAAEAEARAMEKAKREEEERARAEAEAAAAAAAVAAEAKAKARAAEESKREEEERAAAEAEAAAAAVAAEAEAKARALEKALYEQQQQNEEKKLAAGGADDEWTKTESGDVAAHASAAAAAMVLKAEACVLEGARHDEESRARAEAKAAAVAAADAAKDEAGALAMERARSEDAERAMAEAEAAASIAAEAAAEAEAIEKTRRKEEERARVEAEATKRKEEERTRTEAAAAIAAEAEAKAKMLERAMREEAERARARADAVAAEVREGRGRPEKWDPSNEIARGSVSANAARLFGSGGMFAAKTPSPPKRAHPPPPSHHHHHHPQPSGDAVSIEAERKEAAGAALPKTTTAPTKSPPPPPSTAERNGGPSVDDGRHGGLVGVGVVGGDAKACPQRWDPSSEIASGSVSSNAARLFGEGAVMERKKKGGRILTEEDADGAPRATGRDLFATRFAVRPVEMAPPLRHTASELLLRATDRRPSPSSSSSSVAGGDTRRPVVLKFLSDPDVFASELYGRGAVRDAADAPSILPVAAAFVDEGADVRTSSASATSGRPAVEVSICAGLASWAAALVTSPSGGEAAMAYDDDDDGYYDDDDAGTSSSVSGARYPYLLVLDDHGPTLDDCLDRIPLADLGLARAVAGDIVVALMRMHTAGRVHRNLTPMCIVRNAPGSAGKGPLAWQIAGLGSCGEDGESMRPDEVRRRCTRWGYLPPEAARAMLAGTECRTDLSWDLWSLGCVLYRLVLGSEVWKASRDGRMTEGDLAHLAGWSTRSLWMRVLKVFPELGRTEKEQAAIDLVTKLLAPTPEDRLRHFELGIFSVHEHEFIEGKPLESSSHLALEGRRRILAAETRDHDRFLALMGSLGLEEKWELDRARELLLLGVFEPVDVHVPTSFVILKAPIPPRDRPDSAEGDAAEACLGEGMQWLSFLDDISPLVRRMLLERDVRSIGQFWAKVGDMYWEEYCYFYFVDDLTGEPVIPKVSHADGTYPIPIKTQSDTLPKLLPLMHCTMRSAALYHGAVGLARMFGAGANPTLSEEARASFQLKINDLKDKHGGITKGPFGSFIDDIEEVRRHKERFIHNESNVRCKSQTELVRFLERKGIILPESGGVDGDFAGLRRLADKDGRAIWTILGSEDAVKGAIFARAEERMKEEQKLWGTSKVGLAVKQLEADLRAVARDTDDAKVVISKEMVRANAAEKAIADLEKELRTTRTELARVAGKVEELGGRGLQAFNSSGTG